MKKLVLGAALLAAFTLGIFTTTAGAQEIGGRYRVAGKNLDGSPYQGVAEIAVTSRNTCRIVWQTPSISRGWCMRRGANLAAGYVMGEVIGLIMYEIKGDGSLEGIWTIADKTGVGLELLTPAR